MPKIILNEKKYIKEIIQNGDVSNMDISLSQLIYLLAKYYYETEIWHDEDGILIDRPDVFSYNYEKLDENNNPIRTTKTENMKHAVEILTIDTDQALKDLNVQDYYTFKYDKQIRNACSIVIRYDLRLKEFDTIPLLSDELEKIKQCETDREKKLLFTCYIYARYKGKNGKIDDDIVKKALFDMANVKGTKLELNKVIKSLRDKGFISQNFINDNITIWVSMGEGNEVFSVDNLDDLGYKIFNFLHDDYILCEQCHRPTKKKGTNQHYCNKCKDDKRLETKRNWWNNK